MATGVSNYRPMPACAKDFNDILDEEILFPNAAGIPEKRTFYDVFGTGYRIAFSLQTRITKSISHFDPVQDKYVLFQEQYLALEGLIAHCTCVIANFREMIPRYDSSLDKSPPRLAIIKSREDAVRVLQYLEVVSAGIGRCYLTPSHSGNRLPNYLENLKLISDQKV